MAHSMESTHTASSSHIPSISQPFETFKPMSTVHREKKSWSELQEALKKARLWNASYSNKTATDFTFRHIYRQSGRVTRVYFLGVPPRTDFYPENINTILYIDLPTDLNTTTEIQKAVQWNHLLVSFSALSSSSFSKEEALLRERKRLVSYGITSYDVDIESGKFLFPACGSLFTCTDPIIFFENQLATNTTFPDEVKLSGSGTLDPKFCPHDTNVIAYIRNNDIWVASTKFGTDTRLTFLYKGGSKLADNPRSAGVPSFVIQEEFDRYTGYWWRPKTEDSSNSYMILYEEVDESNVPVLSISSPSSSGTDIEEYRYPRPGQPNARSHIQVVQFEFDVAGNVINVIDRRLPDTLYRSYPDMEYLIRAGWTPDGQSVWVQLLNRVQTKLQLVVIPLSSFTLTENTSDSNSGTDSLNSSLDRDEEMPSLNAKVNSVTYLIYEEVNDIWVNVHDNFYLFKQTDPSELSFIWSSEKSGYRHLYLVKAPLTQDNLSVLNENQQTEGVQGATEIQLTSGNWVVLPERIHVDTVRKLIYFTGHKETPLEKHLYVVSYENPRAVTRLTELGYTHTIYMDSLCEMFVTVNSNCNTPKACQMYGIVYQTTNNNDKSQVSVQPKLLCRLQNSEKVDSSSLITSLFTFPSSSGYNLHGMMFKPPNMEVGVKYPTVLYVYGGPQVQLVVNSFKGCARYMRLRTLALLGYVVVTIDSRGSANRGLKFESAIHGKMGEVEIIDQVEGLHWLASQFGFIDLSRVAIHGSSYGGFLSLMALARHAHIFKVAVAASPVTTWQLYDTGYTERYLKLPSQAADSYSQSSVIELAKLFPSQENRLLIVHGLMDENVHFYHTTTLIHSFIKAGIPYQLQVYPNERHGIRQAVSVDYFETQLLNFLEQNL